MGVGSKHKGETPTAQGGNDCVFMVSRGAIEFNRKYLSDPQLCAMSSDVRVVLGALRQTGFAGGLSARICKRSISS